MGASFLKSTYAIKALSGSWPLRPCQSGAHSDGIPPQGETWGLSLPTRTASRARPGARLARGRACPRPRRSVPLVELAVGIQRWRGRGPPRGRPSAGTRDARPPAGSWRPCGTRTSRFQGHRWRTRRPGQRTPGSGSTRRTAQAAQPPPHYSAVGLGPRVKSSSSKQRLTVVDLFTVSPLNQRYSPGRTTSSYTPWPTCGYSADR